MLDFIQICTKNPKKGVLEVYPKFKMVKSSDLMIRGSDFYAIWLEDEGRWSTEEQDVVRLIDRELDKYIGENKLREIDSKLHISYMWDADSGVIDKWHKYCQRQMRDNFHMLDETIVFQNNESRKDDYSSKRLDYPLEKGSTDAYDELMSVLYDEDERNKIEWCIGSIVCGDSKSIQKFLVLYGAAGTGKSTVLNIIQDLFKGYYSVFDARALGSSSNSFALEAFNKNPLIAIQHDGDLSRIEDNTRLNSLVSHELMTVNEKFKSTYQNRFKAFLFMGTNKPVKITDAKSGLIRRLIDVQPTGKKVSATRYRTLMKKIKFELGAIAYKCLDFYQNNKNLYDDYIPLAMMSASNDFYNFVLDTYYMFEKDDGVTLKAAYELYKQYCAESNTLYPLSKMKFKEEFKNYFWEYYDRYRDQNGTRVRNYYTGFRIDKFENRMVNIKGIDNKELIQFRKRKSILDEYCKDCPAQYATENETPKSKWADVTTKLSDLDTTQLHYVKVPQNHIVIDFDIPDENGNKSFEKNLAAASEFPKTYAELSKSGAGIHLHYIYDGDVDKLARVYDDHVEIKVFKGKSSLRRKLTKCNHEEIAVISSGLPFRKEKKVLSEKQIKSEKGLRALIIQNLNKEIHKATKPSVDFIYTILEEAYNNPELNYDVSDMRNTILTFAIGSTNNADYCVNLVSKMKFKSKETAEPEPAKTSELVFFDIEIFPNLFLVNHKKQSAKNCIRLINPSARDIEDLLQFNLVGFNNRRYDNHILYAAMMGYSIQGLYDLSQKIISGDRNAFFAEAYNLSYLDVYDMCSKKQSLKKWEIELKITHKELGLPWDKPVPEEKWNEVAEYCDNDVIATQAVFEAQQADFSARGMLSDVTDMVVNSSTNSLTTRIVFGQNRHPQDEFNYRDLSKGKMSKKITLCDLESNKGKDVVYDDLYEFDEYTAFDDETGMPFFPDYKFELGKSWYRGELVGEGGYVYSEPGIYNNVALLDIASMHPTSIIQEKLFGGKYTENFNELVQARLAIKHKDFDKAREMMGGKLSKYLDDESKAKDLAYALKIAINSVYGLTSAKFDNPFRDPRNKDNIVAKRGALFMVNLKHEVQKRGFTVAHIKTDSIKIPNATPEIIQFVMDYGKLYGYNFEHEATYDKMCLVNDAVYICKHDGKWEATGTQFKVPYVFKTLFSHEPIEFDDLCETKSVKTAMYLDLNESLPNVEDEEKELKKLESKYKKGEISDTIFEKEAEPLVDKITEGHNYIFVGKTGLFVPVVSGKGGGRLVRLESGDRFNAVVGTKGYRWMEADNIVKAKYEEYVDYSYYQNLATEAIEAIEQYEGSEKFFD